MKRFEKRGFTQNRMRFIWKTIKSFFEIATDSDEFTDLCISFYYDTASANVDMQTFRRIVKAVGACR